MKKKIGILLAVIFISCTTITAQKTDQVTLKNGSVIRGTITGIVPDGKVEIDDSAGNTWVFDMKEVDHITKGEQQSVTAGDDFSEGWANITSIGFLAGPRNSQYSAPFSLLTSFGYKYNSGLFTGVSSGIEFLDVNHVPLMIDLQYFLRKSEVSPVCIIRGGYAFPAKAETDIYDGYYTYSGGFTTSVGVGLKIRSKENFAWDISIMYRYMSLNHSEYREWNQQTYKYTDQYNRMELRLGFYLN